MPGWIEKRREFNKFTETVEKRMEKGHIEYGDGSFSRDPLELMNEIQEEIEDISGWSFVLWCRLNDLKKQLANINIR